MATQIIAPRAGEYFRADTDGPTSTQKPPPAPLKGADRVVVVGFSVVIVRAAVNVQIRNRKSEANPFEHAAATDTCRRPLVAGQVFVARAGRSLHGRSRSLVKRSHPLDRLAGVNKWLRSGRPSTDSIGPIGQFRPAKLASAHLRLCRSQIESNRAADPIALS